MRLTGSQESGNSEGGKYHCTVGLLFDWFGIGWKTTEIFCFYLQNRPIQTSQTWGQLYSDTSPLQELMKSITGFLLGLFASAAKKSKLINFDARSARVTSKRPWGSPGGPCQTRTSGSTRCLLQRCSRAEDSGRTSGKKFFSLWTCHECQ